MNTTPKSPAKAKKVLAPPTQMEVLFIDMVPQLVDSKNIRRSSDKDINGVKQRVKNFRRHHDFHMDAGKKALPQVIFALNMIRTGRKNGKSSPERTAKMLRETAAFFAMCLVNEFEGELVDAIGDDGKPFEQWLIRTRKYGSFDYFGIVAHFSYENGDPDEIIKFFDDIPTIANRFKRENNIISA
jgi:hypothetical protein